MMTAVGVRAGHRSVPVSAPPPRLIPCAGSDALTPHPNARAMMLEHSSVERSLAHARRSACCSVHARVQEFERFSFAAIEFVIGPKVYQRASSLFERTGRAEACCLSTPLL